MSTTGLDEESFDDDDRSRDPGPLIRKISVVGLHGRSSFTLDLDADDPEGRLSLLYGENGTGKTTLLRLMWDLLSPAEKKGHRTRVSNVAFERIELAINPNKSIAAIRKVAAPGPYRIELRSGGRLISNSRWPEELPFESFFADWETSTFSSRLRTFDEDIKKVGKEVLAQRKYYEALKASGGAPYFLADDRSTASDELSPSVATIDRRIRLQDRAEDNGYARSTLSTELSRTLEQVNARLRREALGGAVSGSAGANSVYLEVIRHLGRTKDDDSPAQITRKALIEDVRAMGERSKAYESLGLIPRFVSAQYISQINAVPDSNIHILESILTPYLASMKARLGALSEAQRLIQTLLDEVNGFLNDKKFVYERRTLKIQLLDGKALETHQLSSGEQHVLLILLSAVVASGHSRLFLIDEPELSLNVKWQRRIIRSLLTLTEGTGLQFIVATHSIELLSGYRKRVVRMREQ